MVRKNILLVQAASVKCMQVVSSQHTAIPRLYACTHELDIVIAILMCDVR